MKQEAAKIKPARFKPVLKLIAAVVCFCFTLAQFNTIYLWQIPCAEASVGPYRGSEKPYIGLGMPKPPLEYLATKQEVGNHRPLSGAFKDPQAFKLPLSPETASFIDGDLLDCAIALVNDSSLPADVKDYPGYRVDDENKILNPKGRVIGEIKALNVKDLVEYLGKIDKFGHVVGLLEDQSVKDLLQFAGDEGRKIKFGMAILGTDLLVIFDLAEAAGKSIAEPYLQFEAFLSAGKALYKQGRIAEASALIDEALDVARNEITEPYLRYYALWSASLELYKDGTKEKGLKVLNESFGVALNEAADPNSGFYALLFNGETLYSQGRLKEASKLINEAFDIAARSDAGDSKYINALSAIVNNAKDEQLIYLYLNGLCRAAQAHPAEMAKHKTYFQEFLETACVSFVNNSKVRSSCRTDFIFEIAVIMQALDFPTSTAGKIMNSITSFAESMSKGHDEKLLYYGRALSALAVITKRYPELREGIIEDLGLNETQAEMFRDFGVILVETGEKFSGKELAAMKYAFTSRGEKFYSRINTIVYGRPRGISKDDATTDPWGCVTVFKHDPDFLRELFFSLYEP